VLHPEDDGSCGRVHGFMVIGVLALFSPAASGAAYLGAGFGGPQAAFSGLIARRHGG